VDALVELYPRLVVGLKFILRTFRPHFLVILLTRARLLLAFSPRLLLLLLLLQLKLLRESIFLFSIKLLDELLIVFDDMGYSRGLAKLGHTCNAAHVNLLISDVLFLLLEPTFVSIDLLHDSNVSLCLYHVALIDKLLLNLHK
jgi:hypothetical protein